MKKIHYYIISSLIFTLFFSFNVNAATSEFRSSVNDLDGNPKTLVGNTYTSIPYDEMDSFENSDTSKYLYRWHINQNYRIEGFTGSRYYNGFLRYTINVSTSGLERNNPIITNIQEGNGLTVLIRYSQSTYYDLYMIFDNYYTNGNVIPIPTITQVFTGTDANGTMESKNFSYSVIDKSQNLRSTETALDTGLAGMIADSIDNSTALAVIAGYLYDIKTQDYTYYTQLTSQITNILTAQGITNTKLQNILNEIDLDFQQVQAILDLFPSYRTQVLQYWQQLLEMNAAQSQAAAEQESEAADKDNQSQQLINGMGSVSMPSLSTGDLDILSGVDATQKTNFFGLIGLITHTEIVTKIMLIIVMGAIVGYILYGKK